MARDAAFWEAMYRTVIHRLGEINDPTGELLVDQVPKESS